MSSIQIWSDFIEELNARDLGWIVNYAPADLPGCGTPFSPSIVKHLLPEDYLTFVAEVGYPMVGFSYYCQTGFSMFPPAFMKDMSSQVFFDGDESDDPNAPHAAMFAGVELSDVVGWGFRKENDRLGVWNIEGNVEDEVSTSFTEWLRKKTVEILAFADNPDASEEISEGRAEGETDPHRLIDYSGEE